MRRKESFHSKDWFGKGESDIKSAEILLSANRLDTASFHIQQAIEKFLKGFLLHKGWVLKRTHDLVDLLNEAILYEPLFEKFRELCFKATEYYVEDRYPFLILSKLTKSELKNSLKETQDLIEFIGTQMK